MTSDRRPSGALGPRLRTAALTTAALGLALGSVLTAPAASAATVPNAPTGGAVYLGSGSVPVFVWADNSFDETGFEIERCIPTATGCTFTAQATNPANLYAYVDQTNPPISALQYRARAVNAAGASAWTTATLPVVMAYPVAVLSATPTSGTSPLTVSLDGTGSYGLELDTITSWSWSFGDGSTGSGPTTTHVYTAPGTYRVTLTVGDAKGLTSLAETRITVNPPPAVVPAPTGFTATSTVRRRVDLAWRNGSGTTITKLVVGRCTGATCTVFAPVATLAPTATTWRDTTVTSGRTYRYLLTAVDEPAGVAASTGPVTVKAR